MVRKAILLLFSAALVAGRSGQHGALDPAFDHVPFDQWLGERPDTHFHWKARVPHAVLSFHQRLMGAVEITLDGGDLSKRSGNGRIVFLIQITDGEGARYQDHTVIELSKLDENVKAANVEISQQAFFLPGDYQLAIAIFDTATNEHSTKRAQFRVASPPNFLPDAWRNLPSVEFIDNEQSPDSWYLPNIQGRVEWAASVRSPARLNVILNVAPSISEPGSHPTPSSGLAALLPFLKALSQTGSSSLLENVAVLDLGRRRTVFSQNEVKDLDWLRLKASLAAANTAAIDLHSLSDRHHDAQFFVAQARSLLRASENPSVLVVLTTSVAFESGEDLEPISLEALPSCRVFYIRYRASVPFRGPLDPERVGRGRGARMGTPMPSNQPPQGIVDQLEATLKPLHPKVFDVETPDQMTKALIAIRDALLTLDAQPLS